MLKNSITLVLIFAFGQLFACDVCKRQQPAITREWTHGTGPENFYDWIIVGAIALITVLVLFFSLKFLIRPKENDPDHIKTKILN